MRVSVPFLVARLAALSAATAPPQVLFFDLDTARDSESLEYAELALAFTLQGLVNEAGRPPALMMNCAFLNFDWPQADAYWKHVLEEDGRVAFKNVTRASLCALVEEALVGEAIGDFGAVLYDNALPYGNGYTLAMALSVAAQDHLLPMTPRMRQKHACLANIVIKQDLRVASAPHMQTRSGAWRWAIDNLLPTASKNRIFNLYHFDPQHYESDPQSNATLGNLDLAIQNRAFIMDLNPDDAHDLELMHEIFGRMDPLFDAYGWAHDEHAWTRAVSTGGGVVFCSFASPNLSFWALLALPADAVGGKARKLPTGDSGRLLNESKYYVTFETNEGDTPRIVVSAFGSSWASPHRGSLPVAWSVDPVLSERFPALLDYFAATATANDSFIGGVAGAGYVYLGALTTEQLQRYATRTGQLYAQYGPSVADTYGQANLSTIAKYTKYASSAGGLAPIAYVSQPLWAHGTYAQDAWKCPELNMYAPSDGTPIICTSNSPNLFYRNRGLNASHPGEDLAARIRTVSDRHAPPFFITVYGGLNWQPGSTGGKTEFWTLLRSTMDVLGPDFEAIGADEMARLAKDAGKLSDYVV